MVLIKQGGCRFSDFFTYVFSTIAQFFIATNMQLASGKHYPSTVRSGFCNRSIW